MVQTYFEVNVDTEIENTVDTTHQDRTFVRHSEEHGPIANFLA